MSEVERVTSDKPKNPGRQEWGKKLGKMQKELKAKKLADPNEQVRGYRFKWEYGVAIAGLLIGLGALYYQKKSYDVAAQTPTSASVEIQKPQARFSDF